MAASCARALWTPALLAALVMLAFAAPASADGGTSVATATPITRDVLMTGNTASLPPLPHSPYAAYESWWSLSVTAGEIVTLTWSTQSADTGLAIWRAGADDQTVNTEHAIEGEGSEYVDPSTGVPGAIKFTATTTGVMPVLFFTQNDFRPPTPPGPYTFTVHVDPAAPGVAVPPAPTPAPVVTAPERACDPVGGNLGKRLLAAMRCTAHETLLEVNCGVHVALLVGIPAKTLKALKTGKGYYDLRKVKKQYRPIAKLINHIEKAKFKSNAPKGFRTGKDVIARIKNAKSAKDVIAILPSLASAVSAADYSQIALDVADIAGLKSCVQAMSEAVS